MFARLSARFIATAWNSRAIGPTFVATYAAGELIRIIWMGKRAPTAPAHVSESPTSRLW